MFFNVNGNSLIIHPVYSFVFRFNVRRFYCVSIHVCYTENFVYIEDFIPIPIGKTTITIGFGQGDTCLGIIFFHLLFKSMSHT